MAALSLAKLDRPASLTRTLLWVCFVDLVDKQCDLTCVILISESELKPGDRFWQVTKFGCWFGFASILSVFLSPCEHVYPGHLGFFVCRNHWRA